MPPYDPLQFRLLQTAFEALAVLLLVAVVRHRGDLAALDRREGIAIVGAAILAFVLRMTLVEPIVFHENGHGYRYIGMAIDPASDLHVYGSGWQAFFNLIYSFAPPLVSEALVANAILGALTCLFAGLHGSRTFGRGIGAATAAVLAVLPIHVRMSSTESTFVLAMFLAVLALWAMREMREHPSVDLALIAGIAAAACGQMRPLLVALPAFLLVYLFVCAPQARRFARTPAAWITVATTAALLAGHVRWLYRLHLAGGPSHYGSLVTIAPDRVLSSLAETALFFDPGATPFHVLLLALIGTLIGLRRTPRATAPLALLWIALVWIYAARSEYRSEAVRFATPATVVLALLAGPGLAAAAGVVLRLPRGRTFAAILTAVVLATALLSRDPFVQTADGFEYLLLRDGLARVPTGCRVVKPPDRNGDGRIESRLPAYEIAYRLGPPSDGGATLVTTDGYRPTGGCTIYWRGLSCAVFTHDETAGTLRSECAAFESGHRLEALFTRRLQPQLLPEHRFVYAGEAIELGFYRVVE
jgi:hypothetical protein